MTGKTADFGALYLENIRASFAVRIMLLARHIKGPSWQWLTIAPGESEKFRPRSSPR